MTDLKSLLREAEPMPGEVDVDAVMSRGDHLRRQRRQRAGVASAAAAVVLVAGVVGLVARNDGPPDRPVELLAGAGDAAREAGSARMRVVMEASSDGETSRTEIEGVVDFAGDRGRLTATTDGEQVTVLSEGGTVYVSVPEADRGSTGGKPWLSHPISAPGESILNLGDPTHVLDSLKATAGVEVAGTDDVNGFDSTHYAMDPIPGGLGDDAGIDAQIDVWITEDGLPTRITMDYDFGLMSLEVAVDLTDFGVDLDDFVLPDADDVFAGSAQLAEQWLQPRMGEIAAGTADEAACTNLAQIAAVMQQQAAAMTEEQLASLEQALAQIDIQLGTIDDSTPDGAQRRAALDSSAAMLRALVDAGRTGAPIDPATIQATFNRICPG